MKFLRRRCRLLHLNRDRLNQFHRHRHDRHRDDDLDQIRNLPSLKEVWLLHTPRIKRAAVDALKERLEGVEIHYS